MARTKNSRFTWDRLKPDFADLDLEREPGAAGRLDIALGVDFASR